MAKRNRTSDEKGRFRDLRDALHMELREHRSSFIVYFTLRALVIATMILQILNRNYENVFLCALTLILLIMPSLMQITFRVELPTTLEIIILIFILRRRSWARSVSLPDLSLLGHSAPYAERVPGGGHRLLAGGPADRSERTVFNLSPLFTAIVAFCFSMTIGVVWEFFEFGMDQLPDLTCRKTRNPRDPVSDA